MQYTALKEKKKGLMINILTKRLKCLDFVITRHIYIFFNMILSGLFMT
jgi:hypothetical protein